MQRWWSAIALTASIVAVSSLVAQEYGTNIRPRKSAEVTSEGAREARRVLHDFGRCAIQSASRVRAFLRHKMDEPGYSQVLARLATHECLESGGLKIPSANMRAAVFEALYNKEYQQATHVFPPELSGGFAEQYPGAQPDNIRTAVTLEQVGECVAKKDAAAARALLRTRPGSEQESRSFATLLPYLQACIPSDQTFTLSKTVARGAVAEAMYWLTKALERTGPLVR